jgi:hypothetical protein
MQMKTINRKIAAVLTFLLLSSISFSLFSSVNAQYYYPTAQNTLTIYVNNPAGGSVYPGNGTLQYYYGSTVTAYVSTNMGYSFDGWYLNGVYQGKLTAISVYMVQDYTLIATFSVRTVCLTINANPTEGGTTVPAPGVWNYTLGSNNLITVKEYPNSGCTFSGWYLGGVYRGAATSITVNVTQDMQLNAFFAGNGNDSAATGTPSPTATPTEPVASNLPIPSLTFYCTISTTLSGFNVGINGALSYNGPGLTSSGIVFSYSADGGSTWHDLAYLITGDYGNFSGVWMPSASGTYLIRGYWPGDEAYASVSTTVQFVVEPVSNQEQNVFSVASNSTVTSLVFDSTQNQLSFSVSGPSGTSGYVQVSVPNNLIDVSQMQVTLDGQPIQFSLLSENGVWMITFQYHHSSHSVVMSLGEASASSTNTLQPTNQQPSTSTDLYFVIIILAVIATIITIAVLRRTKANKP